MAGDFPQRPNLGWRAAVAYAAALDGAIGEGGEMKRWTAEELLYLCIRELSYVQEPGCRCKNRHLCASGHGADLIERGMEFLNLKDLSAETYGQARKAKT